MSGLSEVTEAEYRGWIQGAMNRIEKSFDAVDPDLAECEQSMGSLTIRFSDQTRCILSAQPSVRQLWVAIASRGTAYHFNFDRAREVWMDDKGRGIELFAFLNTYLKEMVGQDFEIK